MDTSNQAPPNVQVVIIPVAYNRNDGERNRVLDASKAAKKALAARGLNTWTDMRKELNPSQKFQYWEEQGIKARVEIGAKEVNAGKVILADLVNKVKHPTGRLIARRTTLDISELGAAAEAIVNLKVANVRKAPEVEDGDSKWKNLFEKIVDGTIPFEKPKKVKRKKVEESATETDAVAAEDTSEEKKVKKRRRVKKGSADTGGDDTHTDNNNNNNNNNDDNDSKHIANTNNNNNNSNNGDDDDVAKSDKKKKSKKDKKDKKEKKKDENAPTSESKPTPTSTSTPTPSSSTSTSTSTTAEEDAKKSTKSKKQKKAATARRLAQQNRSKRR